MKDSELVEHLHARGYRIEITDVPMIREACDALAAAEEPSTMQVVALPEPHDYYYEWDGPYGNRKFTVAPHNGMQCDRVVPIYTADQMLAAIKAARVQALEPLSEEQIRQWWASENGLEDHDMCKFVHFREVVRAVEGKLDAIRRLGEEAGRGGNAG